MRSRAALTTGLASILSALFATAYAQTDDTSESYRDGRLRIADVGVSIQRAGEVMTEEANPNEPFLPGDRVWTNAVGRADFQFPDGSVVRLDCRSKLDYAGHEQGAGEHLTLRLWSGSLILRVGPRAGTRFDVETPAGTVESAARSFVRIDVDAGEARVSVYDGEAAIDDGREPVRVDSGERSYLRRGEPAEPPQGFDVDEEDDFSRWDSDRQAEERRASGSAENLPPELGAYAGELNGYGDWRYEPAAGEVWVPRVAVGWQPYSNGRWCWTPYGWTWVPFESWGWAPFHYGRWGLSASLGWYWIPGRTWGPAWVSWAVGGGYVGWCPLGRHDRPLTAWGLRRHDGRFDHDHSLPRPGGPRPGVGGIDAWTVVRQGELGRHDVARFRVPIDRLEPSALKVADSPHWRPTRDLKGLREAAPPRAVSTRQSPGDFVRELAVDNKTTIPAPWFRRGALPHSEEGTRYRRGNEAGASNESSRHAQEPGTIPQTKHAGASEQREQPPQTGYGFRDEGARHESTTPRDHPREGAGSHEKPRSSGEGSHARPSGGTNGSADKGGGGGAKGSGHGSGSHKGK